MLVVMDKQATPEQIEAVVAAIRSMGLTPHVMPGTTRTAIGMTGNNDAVHAGTLEVLPGVRELIRVTKPYKLVSREMHPDDTFVRLPQGTIGAGTFTIIAGPCSVENADLMLRTAEFLMSRGVRLLRAGAFKPRTSPYSFQGLGLEGLRILEKTRRETGIAIVTELMDVENAKAVEEVADVIQIGSRNMQNFSLLRRAACSPKPLLLKRGMAATVEEWLMATEYLLAGGNRQVILCERGIRTFDSHCRNLLDLAVVPTIKQLSHLPIIIDPSHGTGRREYVPPMSRAALASGADGLLIEVHPDPDHALSDGPQTISFDAFDQLLVSMRKLVDLVGRQLT